MTYEESNAIIQNIISNIGKPYKYQWDANSKIIGFFIAPLLMEMGDKMDFFKELLRKNISNQDALRNINYDPKELEAYVIYSTGEKDTDFMFDNWATYLQKS